MCQQSSQHKQKTKVTQIWKINFHFANTINMRNGNLQPRAPPLDSINNKICLPSKAFLNPASNNFSNPQQDFSIQLTVATCRLGSNGNGAAVLRLKNLTEQST
ncbi:uncharacterized protein VP01_807g14 [Puccinia sorghi]|uniref:Uncharacterized protein n=1 Tax=Puccinia sorghi TaxID=27349 RepID=A0A0L6UAA6_9BASI|nr:uncharacterized protein VP01_807g14 [Puccinia sorghi]